MLRMDINHDDKHHFNMTMMSLDSHVLIHPKGLLSYLIQVIEIYFVGQKTLSGAILKIIFVCCHSTNSLKMIQTYP